MFKWSDSPEQIEDFPELSFPKDWGFWEIQPKGGGRGHADNKIK